MPGKELPFATPIYNFVNAPVQIKGLHGYTTRLRGISLALGPFPAVTGLARLEIDGLADYTQLGQALSDQTEIGQLQFYVQPSTTLPVSLVVPFGDAGVEAPGPGENFPLKFTLFPHGSDVVGSDISLTAWGLLVPE